MADEYNQALDDFVPTQDPLPESVFQPHAESQTAIATDLKSLEAVPSHSSNPDSSMQAPTSLKLKKDQKASIRKDETDSRHRSRNSDKEAMREKEKNADNYNRRRSSEVDKNKIKAGASLGLKKAGNNLKVNSILPVDSSKTSSSFNTTSNDNLSPSRPNPPSPLLIEVEKEEEKEGLPFEEREEQERTDLTLPDYELESLISCKMELFSPTSPTLFTTQSLSSSNSIPWQPFDILSMTHLPGIEQWWRSIRDLTAHHKWMNMAQLLLQYMLSHLSPKAGQEWTKMITESSNPDLSAFISFIIASPSSQHGFSITQNPHPAWDSLSTQAKGKYALLRYCAVQFQLSRIFLLFWAGLLQTVSFKDGCILPFDFSTPQTHKHSIQQWILKANQNPTQLSTLFPKSLEEGFNNQKILQQRWIEAHQLAQDPNENFQSEIGTMLDMNFAFIPSLQNRDYVFPLLREMAMKIPDHTTAIKDYKASFPFSKNGETNCWKIRSPNHEFQTFVDPPTDLLPWTHAQGISKVLPSEKGYIMTKLDLKATIRSTEISTSSSQPKIQISIHPLQPSTHERYPPFIIREATLATHSEVLQGLFTLNSTFATNEVESTFLMDQFFLNQGYMCLESILKCSPEHKLQSIQIATQFEGFTGNLKTLSFYLFALWMYSYTRSSLSKISDQVLKDISYKKKGAREALLIVFPDQSCNGTKF